MVQDVNEWVKRAGCRDIDDVNVFFPMFGEYERAKEICSDCQVVTECLNYALSFEVDLYGVFGGLTPNERWEIRKKANLVVVTIHGH